MLLTTFTATYPLQRGLRDGRGQMVRATVFTLTTEFTYNGLGARVAVSVAGQTTNFALDYAAGNRILAETTPTSTVQYLYGDDCLGEFRDNEPLYYLPDAEGYVRQGTDADGDVVSAWLFDPDGTVLAGPDGLVSHLVCGGVYDWSTGLLYKGERYFDPMLGIWLALLPLAVVQGRKKKRRGGHPWVLLVCVGLFAVGSLAGCDPPTPGTTPTIPPEAKEFICTDWDQISPPPIECDTHCKELVKELGIVRWQSGEQAFLASKPGGDLKPWKSESGKSGTMYGTKAAFQFFDHSGLQPEYTEVDANCIMIQLVEGHRFLTNPDEVHYNNDGVYFLDGPESTGEYNFLALNYVPRGGEWVITDEPASFVELGQSIDWRETYVTRIYEKCADPTFDCLYDAGSTVPYPGGLDLFSDYLVAELKWKLAGSWTHPLDYQQIIYEN